MSNNNRLYLEGSDVKALNAFISSEKYAGITRFISVKLTGDNSLELAATNGKRLLVIKKDNEVLTKEVKEMFGIEKRLLLDFSKAKGKDLKDGIQVWKEGEDRLLAYFFGSDSVNVLPMCEGTYPNYANVIKDMETAEECKNYEIISLDNMKALNDVDMIEQVPLQKARYSALFYKKDNKIAVVMPMRA